MTAIARCTNCDSAFKVKGHLVGKAIRCPNCGEAFRVESSGGAPTASSKSSSATGGKLGSGHSHAPNVDGFSSQTPAVPNTSEGFFDTHEDVDATYAAHVVVAKHRKRQQQLIFLISCGSLAAIVLIVGTVVAFQYAYDNTAVPLQLADPRSVDTTELDGSWRPYSDTQWGYSVRMPGDPEIDTKNEDKIRSLSIRDQQFGTMRIELRKESHTEWNDYFAKLERAEIFLGVPAGNLMKISSEVTYRNDSTAVHRYILVSKDSRYSKNVAVVHKFFVEGTTITAMWSGKREMLRSPEVLYFFSSIEISGNRYLTH
ncbi:hypothetical protein [Bremerella alba]|uniref:Uncharacterized protein n=1 Tax=Bremerella alba TaxID=980252 RepID=A0A7V8V5S6_9BACT|nr:hypothetical protein [Bremerella alba]MBA2115286.1 hypothetical protein [Bremerella alba]